MTLKIDKIEVFVVAGVNAKYKTSPHYSDLVITNTIVKIRTSDGYEGFGAALSWTEGGIDKIAEVCASGIKASKPKELNEEQ